MEKEITFEEYANLKPGETVFLEDKYGTNYELVTIDKPTTVEEGWASGKIYSQNSVRVEPQYFDNPNAICLHIKEDTIKTLRLIVPDEPILPEPAPAINIKSNSFIPLEAIKEVINLIEYNEQLKLRIKELEATPFEDRRKEILAVENILVQGIPMCSLGNFPKQTADFAVQAYQKESNEKIDLLEVVKNIHRLLKSGVIEKNRLIEKIEEILEKYKNG